MGNCYNRATNAEIIDHIKEGNGINNRHFKYIKFTPEQSQDLLFLGQTDLIEAKKFELELKHCRLLKQAQSITSDLPYVKEFLIEVQKGVHLFGTGLCINKGGPVVGCSLEPSGMYKETFPADSFRPKWYQLINIKTLIDFKAIKFVVKWNSGGGVLGSFSIRIDDIKHQRVLDNWFAITDNKGEEAPEIKIRVQYIHNKTQLYLDMANECAKRCNELSQMLSKIEGLEFTSVDVE